MDKNARNFKQEIFLKAGNGSSAEGLVEKNRIQEGGKISQTGKNEITGQH